MPRQPERRDTIKQQALRLFVEHGVDGVSTRDIAHACQMTSPNLYSHFRSKEALVSELFHEGYADYGAIVAAAVAGPGPFRARLDAMVRAILRLHDEDNARFRFLIMAQHGYLRTVARDEHNPVEVICRAVAEAMARGEIPQRDPLLMAAGLIGQIVQPATFRLYGRLDGGLSERAEDIVAMCWRVLS